MRHCIRRRNGPPGGSEGVLQQHMIVIGPTPPGTGVIQLATSFTRRRRHRPPDDSRVCALIIDLVDAHIGDDGTGLHPVAPTISARPTAATRMSARLTMFARSRLRE